ncbi:MAG: hypothetical protein OHK0053_16430 [Microscillaceae bacterium]
MLLTASCEIRDIEDLQAPSFPNTAEVFIDGFTGDLEYAAFGGSDVTAFQVDGEVTFDGSQQSMRFAVPDANSPQGAFAGGMFFSRSGRDLSGYNALSFYIRASQPATIGEVGFGVNPGGNNFQVTLPNLAVNTNWQRVILPIPDASRLLGEKGLLYYAAGPENGRGFTFWIDEVRFERLSDLGSPIGLIENGLDQVIDNAETGEKLLIEGLQAKAILPTGINQTVNISPYYFTFSSSNPTIAGVDDKGEVSVIDAGTTTITAKLGENAAEGSLELTSVGAPVGPTEVAPTPTLEPEDVISLFSNAYTNVPVDTWNARYLFSTVDEFFIQVEGDDVIRYRDLNFVGIEFRNPTVNASSMTTFHIDIWTPDPTNLPNNFKVLLADLGADGNFGGGDDSNHEVTITSPTLSTGNWIGIDIPLSAFTGLASRAHLGQMVLSGSLPNLYIDNVYFYRNPVIPPTAAPVPTTPAEDVLSIYSDTYTNIAGTDFNPNWGQSGFTTATEIAIQGNNTRSYPNFNYQGIQLASAQDVSSYGFLHLDYYSANATTLNVFLISPPNETPYALSVPTSGWNSVDIPLSAFAGVDLSQVLQFKFDGGNGGTNILLDNIYFWRSPAPPTVPVVAAPVPTRPSEDVLSVFSDSYTNISGTDFNPNWGQSGFTTAGQIVVAGNNTLAYPNFNYQGIQLGSAQNISEYQNLHLDFYSTNSTTLRVFLISPGPVETPVTLTVPTNGWSSIDIPLSSFAPVDLTNVIQFKFDGGTTTESIYLDNIYFFKSGGGGGGSCPTPPAGDFIVDGNFEANAGCWELFAFQAGTSTTIVTNESNGGGSNSARIKTAQAGNPGIKQTRFGVGLIQPNTTYEVKFDIRADAADPVANGSVLNAFTFSEAAEGSGQGAIQHTLVAGDPNISTTWTTRTYTFTTAANVAGGVSLLIELIGGGPTTTGTIFIDNVSLRAQ